jgi:4-oxalomesaconate hydratase
VAAENRFGPVAVAWIGYTGDRMDAADSKTRILVVSAHPADFCSRAGGTLIKHVHAGHLVKVIWLSHGETDESHLLYKQRPGISLAEVRQVREREAFACVKVIGADGVMLGFGDNPLRMTPERMEMLVKEMTAFQPTVILTHWTDEFEYSSHWVTAKSAIEAAQIADGSWDIRFFEPTIGTAGRTGFVPDHYVDISDVFEQKRAALNALETQPHLVEYYTVCGRWRGLESGCTYAEGFVRWAPKPAMRDLLA